MNKLKQWFYSGDADSLHIFDGYLIQYYMFLALWANQIWTY